jgi:hypothetical protein
MGLMIFQMRRWSKWRKNLDKMRMKERWSMSMKAEERPWMKMVDIMEEVNLISCSPQSLEQLRSR